MLNVGVPEGVGSVTHFSKCLKKIDAEHPNKDTRFSDLTNQKYLGCLLLF